MRIAHLATAALIVVALAGCTPETPTDVAPSESSKPVESVTPGAEGTPEPEPEETTEAPVEPEGLSPDDLANLQAAVETGNTAALEGYLTNPVNFIIAASECCGPVTPLEAISGFDYMSAAVGPWAAPTASQLTQYRAGFYVDYFPEGAFVIQSSDADPYVVSFAISGENVTGIFIAGGASLLLP